MSGENNYLIVNPLAEHNSNIALSSKNIPNVGTGSFYQGQGGRAFVQGGGSASSYFGFNVGESGTEHTRGSYPSIISGNNANASSPFSIKNGGRKRLRKIRGKKRITKAKKRYSRKHNSRNARTSRKRVLSYKKMQRGGASQFLPNGDMVVGWGAPNGSSVPTHPNAAYSVGGATATDVTSSTTALANPPQITAYNSAHPVM